MTTRKQLIYKKSNKSNKFRKTRSKKGGVTTRSETNTTKSTAIKATRKTKKSKLPEIQESCGICLDYLNKSDNIPSLPCKHQFHKDCLIELCKSQNNRDVKCPFCRGDIVDVCADINPQPDYVGFAPIYSDLPPLLTMADLEPDTPLGSPLTMADLEPDGPTIRTFNNYDEEEDILRNGNVGDLVNFEPNNQMGVVYYKISLNNGEKYLEAIGDYEGYYDDPNYGMMGGKQKRKTKQRGGNINAELIQASRNGRTETVAMLLEKGADMNATDNYGETVLQWASENGHTEIVTMLLKKGADVNAKRNCGNTALSSASYRGYTEIVKMLLKNGAIVNAEDNHGWTALQLASENGRIETVQMLLDKGADVNAKMEYGYTAFSKASKNGHTEIVVMLLDKGADINTKDNDGYTALIVASLMGHTEIVVILLENGADVNAKNDDGYTALQSASEMGHIDIVKLLKQHIVQQIVPKHLERKKDKKNVDLLSERMPNELLDKIGDYLGGKRKTKKSRRKQKINIKTKRGGYVYSTDWMTEAKIKGEVIPTIENNKILLRELGFSMNPDTKIIIKPKDKKSNIKYFVYDKNDCDTNHIKNCEPISISKPNTNNPYGRNNGGKRKTRKKI